ncbi:MAG: hypothetical protein F4Z82_07510 [Caldilineaceae bacterium SB0668_bin_21]|nr:hypothetical protein [Caldilineaceae bacterium SB0668_bin_21]MYC22774.1 hypothetical protein [Caldilineaceae bacterium SB0662_bin_25]
MSREEAVVVCPRCENTVRREARFCDQCGRLLSPEESADGSYAEKRDELSLPDASDGTVRDEAEPGVEAVAEGWTEPQVEADVHEAPHHAEATFQEKVRSGVRTLVLWSGSPLLLLLVLVGAVARDNFRRADSQAAPSLQGENVEAVPGGVPGMALPLEIVTPFTGEERSTDFETVGSGFARPRGAAIANGNIYIVDAGQGALFVLNVEGRQMVQIDSSDRRFVEPVDVAADGEGNVYVLDAGDGGRVSIHGPDGAFQEVVPVPDGAADRSRGLDVDSEGRIWLAMTPALAVAAFDRTGRELMRISTDFEGTDLQPVDVAFQSESSIFVSTAGMTSVLRFTAAGELLNLWPLVTANSVDGPHLALDNEGNVYVTQPEQGGILRISGDGVEDLAAWILLGGPPLRKLVGISAGEPGSLVVTDSDNGKIYRVEISP